MPINSREIVMLGGSDQGGVHNNSATYFDSDTSECNLADADHSFNLNREGKQ